MNPLTPAHAAEGFNVLTITDNEVPAVGQPGAVATTPHPRGAGVAQSSLPGPPRPPHYSAGASGAGFVEVEDGSTASGLTTTNGNRGTLASSKSTAGSDGTPLSSRSG